MAFGWRYARRHLPAEVVGILSACDGIEFLRLNRRVKDAVVDSLPDWKSRVMEAVAKLAAAEENMDDTGDFDGLDDDDDD